jgi:hypothetical protein
MTAKLFVSGLSGLHFGRATRPPVRLCRPPRGVIVQLNAPFGAPHPGWCPAREARQSSANLCPLRNSVSSPELRVVGLGCLLGPVIDWRRCWRAPAPDCDPVRVDGPAGPVCPKRSTRSPAQPCPPNFKDVGWAARLPRSWVGGPTSRKLGHPMTGQASLTQAAAIAGGATRPGRRAFHNRPDLTSLKSGLRDRCSSTSRKSGSPRTEPAQLQGSQGRP